MYILFIKKLAAMSTIFIKLPKVVVTFLKHKKTQHYLITHSRIDLYINKFNITITLLTNGLILNSRIFNLKYFYKNGKIISSIIFIIRPIIYRYDYY